MAEAKVFSKINELDLLFQSQFPSCLSRMLHDVLQVISQLVVRQDVHIKG